MKKLINMISAGLRKQETVCPRCNSIHNTADLCSNTASAIPGVTYHHCVECKITFVSILGHELIGWIPADSKGVPFRP
jgi:hypothetical protein